MNSVAILPVLRLKSATRSVAVALLLFIPAAAMADRPRVRPHHKVPAKVKRIIAARAAAERAATGSTTVNHLAGGSGMYLGGTTTTAVRFSINAIETLTAVSATVTFGSTFALSADLVKSGAGTLTLNSAASFTGNTTLNAGTLSLTTSLLPDAGALSLATGATLNLNFAGTDTINQLRIDGVVQNPGTWGSLISSATNRTALITGTGILNVTGDGGTTINTGALTLNGNNLSVSNAGTLNLNGNTATTSSAGIATLTNATIITTPTGTGSTAGTLTINSGTLSAAALSMPAEEIGTSEPRGAGGAAPVPEPSSALLALLGAGLLSARRRRG